MLITRITATEAIRNFSDILNRAYYQGELFEVTRNGVAIARIKSALLPWKTLGEIFDRIDRGPGFKTA